MTFLVSVGATLEWSTDQRPVGWAACRLGCSEARCNREKAAQCHTGIALSSFVMISKRIFLYETNILVLESLVCVVCSVYAAAYSLLSVMES